MADAIIFCSPYKWAKSELLRSAKKNYTLFRKRKELTAMIFTRIRANNDDNNLRLYLLLSCQKLSTVGRSWHQVKVSSTHSWMGYLDSRPSTFTSAHQSPLPAPPQCIAWIIPFTRFYGQLFILSTSLNHFMNSPLQLLTFNATTLLRKLI